MRSILRALDLGVFRVVYIVCGLSMAALLIIVNVQVAARYAFHFSLGGVSDLPPYIMIYAVWLGAMVAARTDDHLKIELLDLLVKKKRVLEVVNGIFSIVMAGALVYFTVYAIDYTASAVSFGSTDMGTKVPLWIYYIVMPISTAFMAFYYLINAVKKLHPVKP
jgi:TRAP-type C4-dicarboxylate transport system permease small subunit